VIIVDLPTPVRPTIPTLLKKKKKKKFAYRGIGQGVSMAVLAGTTSQTSNPLSLHSAMEFLTLVNLAYSYGFLGCCLLYAAEVSPMWERSFVSGIAVCVTWTTNFFGCK
jgi:hypothetical protein